MRSVPDRVYQQLALATDRYQLTMGQAYFNAGVHETKVVFHLFFRRCPFGGEYAVSAGLGYLIDYLQNNRFTDEAIEYLAHVHAPDGTRQFTPEYLRYLRRMENGLTVHAMPEGTLAFPNEPMVRVEGPLIQAQLPETPFLNFMNFGTLIATKAARICWAAGGRPVFEFGMRRAQGLDGAATASRAAYIGGAAGTSNEQAGFFFGIPVKGTHAHSLVMFFEDELQAFLAYGRALPNNLVFLVDTYRTLRGVQRAVEAASKLGAKLAGIRLDSGDLARLSTGARRILDNAGYREARIVASNDLDERIIQALLQQQGALIDVLGVGTKLVTGGDQAALGGVYKLAAVARGGEFRPEEWRIKLSEQVEKTTIPGPQDVLRIRGPNGCCLGDVIHTAGSPPEPRALCPLIRGEGRELRFRQRRAEPVLVPIFDEGKLVYDEPTLEEMQARTRMELERLSRDVKRFENPAPYRVALEPGLAARRAEMIQKAAE